MRDAGRPLAAVAMLALVALAGCAESEDDHFADGHTHEDEAAHGAQDDAAESHAHATIDLWDRMPTLTIELQDCTEAGGISIYNSQEGASGPTKPFVRANTLYDVGEPTIGTYGQPVTSDHTTGIWHMAGQCSSYSINGEPRDGAFHFGWVGVKVEPPEFDPDGPERQYFITDLSFMDHDVVEFLREEVGLHATRMLEGGAIPMGPGAVNVLMNDEDHGIFETHMTLKDYGAMDVPGFRQWLYIPADGDLSHGHSHDASGVDGLMYQPVSLDIVNHGAGTHEVSTDGTGWFSHSRTNHHGEAQNGASGNLPGLRWSGFDRTITLGPVPDVRYDQTWLH